MALLATERPPAEQPAQPRRPGHLAEVVAFTAFLAPRLAGSFLPGTTANAAGSFGLSSVFGVADDLGLVALVWFLLASRSESFSSVGLRRPSVKEVGLGIVLAGPIWYAARLTENMAVDLGASGPKTGAILHADGGAFAVVIGVLLVLTVGITEEFVFRGYLIRRLEQAGAAPWMAGLGSGFLFVLGHGYEGPAALAAIVVFTIAMTRLVRLRRSLTAAIAAHVVFDLLAIVVLPLIG